MAHSFLAYIDESGDDGLSNFRRVGARGGSSHWLNISVMVTRATHNLELVSWRDSIGKLRPQAQTKSRSIHFVDFNHAQRVAACQRISELPVRFCNVISKKDTIEAGTYTEKNQLYFYLTRYLIERLSWLCRDLRPRVQEGNGLVKITFSRRGGLSMDGFKNYLRLLKSDQADGVRIHWPVIDIDNIEALDHSANAGLQLADFGASAIAAGFEPDFFGNCEARYAEIIKPTIYTRNNNYFSYGLKLVPKTDEMQLSTEQIRTISLFK